MPLTFAAPAEKTQAPFFCFRTLAVLPDARREEAAFFAAVMVLWQLTFLYFRVLVAMSFIKFKIKKIVRCQP
jgi:hypothetical protein